MNNVHGPRPETSCHPRKKSLDPPLVQDDPAAQQVPISCRAVTIIEEARPINIHNSD